MLWDFSKLLTMFQRFPLFEIKKKAQPHSEVFLFRNGKFGTTWLDLYKISFPLIIYLFISIFLFLSLP